MEDLNGGHKISIITSQKPHARHLTLHWLSSHELNPGGYLLRVDQINGKFLLISYLMILQRTTNIG